MDFGLDFVERVDEDPVRVRVRVAARGRRVRRGEVTLLGLVLVQEFVQLQVEALHRQLGVFSGGLVYPRRGHLFQQIHIKVAERVFHMVPYGRVGIDAAFINGTHVCQLIELLLLIVPQEEVAAALLFV